MSSEFKGAHCHLVLQHAEGKRTWLASDGKTVLTTFTPGQEFDIVDCENAFMLLSDKADSASLVLGYFNFFQCLLPCSVIENLISTPVGDGFYVSVYDICDDWEHTCLVKTYFDIFRFFRRGGHCVVLPKSDDDKIPDICRNERSRSEICSGDEWWALTQNERCARVDAINLLADAQQLALEKNFRLIGAYPFAANAGERMRFHSLDMCFFDDWDGNRDARKERKTLTIGRCRCD